MKRPWETVEGLGRKLRKLRRDPEWFAYDLLRKRLESRPVPPPIRVKAGRPPLPQTTPETTSQLDANRERFVADIETKNPATLVFIFSGTTYVQDVRANRPIRLAREFRKLGAAVIFSFYRWKPDDHVPSYDDDLLYQTPIDYTMSHLDELARLHPIASKRLFVLGFPYPEMSAALDRVNATGFSTIYDCRDDWELFAQNGQAVWYTDEAEAFALTNSDMSCCVSHPLVSKMQSIAPRARVELSPNAYDPQFRASDYHRDRRDVQTTPPIVGYFGHLSAAWFNWPALCSIARHRPDYEFEIIGHSQPDDLRLPANVTLLGPKNHAEICSIANRWSTAIIPFKIGPLADGVDPIKIYEYLALGLPTVSFRMPQIVEYPYTTTVGTVPAFARALDAAIKTECDTSVIDEFLTANTWRLRAQQMLDWASEFRDDPFKTLLASCAPSSASERAAR